MKRLNRTPAGNRLRRFARAAALWALGAAVMLAGLPEAQALNPQPLPPQSLTGGPKRPVKLKPDDLPTAPCTTIQLCPD